MKCNSCGHDNVSSAKYCEKCGTVLENTENLLKRGIQNKKIVIIGGAVIFAIILIAVLILSTQKATPHEQVLSALAQEQYDDALRLFDANRVEINTEQKQEIEVQLIEIAEATKKDYISRSIDYESALAVFQKLRNWGFADVSSCVKDCEAEIADIDAVHVLIQTGDECVQKENYIGAIHYFSEVPPDSADYPAAQEKLASSQNAYRESLQAQAALLAEKSDYIGAISLLSSGLEILVNDQVLTTDISTYTDEYVVSISDAVDELCSNGNYQEAIQTATDAIDKLSDSRLEEVYEVCTSTYVSTVVDKADTYAAEGNYIFAIEELNSALKILPENEQLQDALKKHNWTTVLYADDSFTIVRKDLATFDSNTIRVGIMDAKGNWLVPLSSEFIFAKAIQKESGRPTLTGTKTAITDDNVYYLGEGIFVMSLGVEVRSASGYRHSVGSFYSTGSSGLTCYMYNVNNGMQTSFSAVWISKCSDENMLMYNSDRYNSPFYRVDTDGNITELPVRHEVNNYEVFGFSEGLFFANGYFYDIYGAKQIDLTEYAIINTPYFTDGVCTIEFKNNMGTLYRATIDKEGNFVKEPEKVS